MKGRVDLFASSERQLPGQHLAAASETELGKELHFVLPFFPFFIFSFSPGLKAFSRQTCGAVFRPRARPGAAGMGRL
jgi:hypothetical protein